MADVEVVAICSNPGCDQPGTKSCSACKITPYCGSICQTADWPKHKEECPGHLRKVGMNNLVKALEFDRQKNWAQSLRYAELAATKLKQLKDRSLETVERIDAAMKCKFNALNFMDRKREAMECAEENYTLWAMNHMRNPGSMRAALGLIQSCIHNDEYEDAVRYGHHAMFMINEMTDNLIPVEQRPPFLADTSRLLAVAMYRFAEDGGYPPEEVQKAGEEAIGHARKALEIHTQLHGPVCDEVAHDLGALATTLGYFNDIDHEQVLRLHEQATAMYSRLEGSSSLNVAVCEDKMGRMFHSRAMRALDADDLDRCITNLKLALPRYRAAVRIFKIVNLKDRAAEALSNIAQTEGNLGHVYGNRALTARAANDLDRCMTDLELALPHHREAARTYREINDTENADGALKNIEIFEFRIRDTRTARAAAATTTTGRR